MTQSQLHKQETQMLEEMLGILQRRGKQYSHAFVHGVYIKEEDGTGETALLGSQPV